MLFRSKAEKELVAAQAKGEAASVAAAQARLASAKMLLEAAEKYA